MVRLRYEELFLSAAFLKVGNGEAYTTTKIGPIEESTGLGVYPNLGVLRGSLASLMTTSLRSKKTQAN